MPSPARSVSWQFVLCDASGNALCEIDTASGKQIVFKRNSFPEATLTLSYKDAAAQSLIDCLYGASYIGAQIPTLKAYRKGPNDSSAQLRFYGYLAPFQDQADTEQALLTPIFRGPFSKLLGDGNNRGFFTDADHWYPNNGLLDAGQIALKLIQAAQAVSINASPPTNLTVTLYSGGILQGTTTYYWQVTALKGGAETASTEVSAATGPGHPSGAVLSWTSAAGATGYRIYRATSSGGESTSPALVATVGAGTTSYTDVGNGPVAGAVPSSSAAFPIGGGSGIATNGTIQTSVPRQKEYQSANVGQEIVNLTTLLDGFDFEVSPLDGEAGALGTFNVYVDQGTTQLGAKFEYGAGTLANLKGLRRTISPPINAVVVLGGNGLSSIQQDATSQTQYGVWPVQVSASDIIDQPTLDAKAKGMLRRFPVKTLEIQPESALAPRPWDDYWIGDSVPVYANHGALQENTLLRVNTIQVVVDENGYEAAEVQDPVSAEKGVHKTMIKSKLAGEVTDDSG